MTTYIAKTLEDIDNGTRDRVKCWDYLRVGVFEVNEETKEEKQVGEYKRNYSSLYDTFYPFKQGVRLVLERLHSYTSYVAS